MVYYSSVLLFDLKFCFSLFIIYVTMIMKPCIHCQDLSKYKCPVCIQPYCSVACYKIHKEIPCSAPPKPVVEEAKESTVNYEFPTEDTVPIEKLELLEKSNDVRTCLENPHLRTILEQLDKSPNPEDLIDEYMQEPIFTELVDAFCKVVQRNDD